MLQVFCLLRVQVVWFHLRRFFFPYSPSTTATNRCLRWICWAVGRWSSPKVNEITDAESYASSALLLFKELGTTGVFQNGFTGVHGCHVVFLCGYEGVLKWCYPQNTPKWSFLVGKPMVVGYHHFRKQPYMKCRFDLLDGLDCWSLLSFSKLSKLISFSLVKNLRSAQNHQPF